MATAVKNHKSWNVRFYDQSKTRRTLSMGKVGAKAARSAACHVEALVTAIIGGHSPEAAHITWATAQQDRIRNKLVEWG